MYAVLSGDSIAGSLGSGQHRPDGGYADEIPDAAKANLGVDEDGRLGRRRHAPVGSPTT